MVLPIVASLMGLAAPYLPQIGKFVGGLLGGYTETRRTVRRGRVVRRRVPTRKGKIALTAGISLAGAAVGTALYRRYGRPKMQIQAGQTLQAEPAILSGTPITTIAAPTVAPSPTVSPIAQPITTISPEQQLVLATIQPGQAYIPSIGYVQTPVEEAYQREAREERQE